MSSNDSQSKSSKLLALKQTLHMINGPIPAIGCGINRPIPEIRYERVEECRQAVSELGLSIHAEKSLRLEVTNAMKLTDFLRELERTDLEKDVSLRMDIQEVALKLVWQIRQHYESVDPDRAYIPDDTGPIARELYRLGLYREAKTIVKFSINSIRRTLHEFLTLEYLVKKTSVTAKDLDPKAYAENLRKAEEEIQTALHNPKAISLAKNSLNSLINAIDETLAVMEMENLRHSVNIIDREASEEDGNTFLKRKAIRSIARKYKERLEKIREQHLQVTEKTARQLN